MAMMGKQAKKAGSSCPANRGQQEGARSRCTACHMAEGPENLEVTRSCLVCIADVGGAEFAQFSPFFHMLCVVILS